MWLSTAHYTASAVLGFTVFFRFSFLPMCILNGHSVAGNCGGARRPSGQTRGETSASFFTTGACRPPGG